VYCYSTHKLLLWALRIRRTQEDRTLKTTLINFIVVTFFFYLYETAELEMATEAPGECLCG
jgi:hypothetical protein